MGNYNDFDLDIKKVQGENRLRQHQGGQRRLQRRLPGHLRPGGRVIGMDVTKG